MLLRLHIDALGRNAEVVIQSRTQPTNPFAIPKEIPSAPVVTVILVGKLGFLSPWERRLGEQQADTLVGVLEACLIAQLSDVVVDDSHKGFLLETAGFIVESPDAVLAGRVDTHNRVVVFHFSCPFRFLIQVSGEYW
jgi:hypothetical protein